MDILTINNHLADKSVGKLLTDATEIEKEILAAIEELLSQFDTKGGKFVRGKDTDKLINGLKGTIDRIIQQSQFPSAVDGFLLNFDQLEENMQAIHQELNKIKVPSSLISKQKVWAIQAVTFNMKEAQVLLNFIDPVKRVLFNYVNSGSGLLEANKEMRRLVLGADKRNGLIERWIGHAARDAIYQYEGAVNTVIADKYGLERIRYVGSLVEDSRPQCKRWISKKFLKKSELSKEISWAKNNGSGMIPTTGPENFMVNRGGYNCRHSAYPTR